MAPPPLLTVSQECPDESCVAAFSFVITVSELFTFSMRALMAKITVLADISTAPIAGDSNMPQAYRAPAAKGIAATLWPVAQKRFWIGPKPCLISSHKSDNVS